MIPHATVSMCPDPTPCPPRSHSLEPPLPVPFAWRWIFPEGLGRTDVELRAQPGGEVIAVVTQMHGRWHTTVNLHRSSHQIAGARCASCEQGMRWLVRWLAPRAGKIRGELEAKQDNLTALAAARAADTSSRYT